MYYHNICKRIIKIVFNTAIFTAVVFVSIYLNNIDKSMILVVFNIRILLIEYLLALIALKQLW